MKCGSDVSKGPLSLAGEGAVDATITYSYSVTFRTENNVKWSSRYWYTVDI